MHKESKLQFVVLISVLFIGSVLTCICSLFYFNAIYQEDPLYEEIPFQKGMSFARWQPDSFNSTIGRTQILEMKEAGIEWVAINNFYYQKNTSSTEIYSTSITDTPENLIDSMDFIHAQGMKVLFKPMLDSEDGVWRSFIQASDEWIIAYNEFINFTAEIANNGSAELFSIGCEMGNWQGKKEAVENVIEDVRQIYSGKITYAATHASFQFVEFWDKVDVIGVDAYFPFTLSYDPTLEDMIASWNGFYEDLERTQRKYNKPIILTEVGTQNREGNNIAPENDILSTEQDIEEGQLFYESFFNSKIWSAPWFKGAYWWVWTFSAIDEVENSEFAPNHPVIKYTIHKYYSEPRVIEYPNYFINLALIIVLGGSITVITSILYKKNFQKSKTRVSREEQDQVDEESESKTLRFIVFGGLLFGTFIFWSFTYSIQILFTMGVGTLSALLFQNESIIGNLIFICVSVLLVLIIWKLIQLMIKKSQEKYKAILILGISSAGLIIAMESFFANVLYIEMSLLLPMTLLIMGIFGNLLNAYLKYGFPSSRFKEMDPHIKRAQFIRIIVGILAVGFSLFIALSFLMRIDSRQPSIIIGIILMISLPFLIKDFKKSEYLLKGNSLEKKRKNHKKEEYPKFQMKSIEFILCLFAFGYYFGILRFYNPHVMLNFYLNLLPSFFIPVGISILIAIPLIFGLWHVMVNNSSKINGKFDLERNGKTVILPRILKGTILISIPIMVVCWWLGEISYEVALILGGIPLLMIFIIFLIGILDTPMLFPHKGSWERLTLYLIICLSFAFIISGIRVLVYYLYTLVVFEGQMFFGQAIEFDLIQLIYDIQLLITLLIMGICYISLKLIIPKIRR